MTFSFSDNDSLQDIAAHLLECDDFVICGHVSPDGDCVGSQLALAAALRALGKNVRCISASSDPLPYALTFMPGADEIDCVPDPSGECETFIAVDVSVESRFGNGIPYFQNACTTFILDHHACDNRIADYSFIDPDSPSATMIIWKLVKVLCPEPPQASALCAYTGLLTDTGGFCFQNTSAEAFSTAAELVSQGVDPSFVAAHVFQSKSPASLNLERILLERMETFAEGEAVLSYISLDDMTACDARKSDTEHLVDVIRSLRGVRVACMMRQQEGSIKGSLRAKDDTDVASLAVTLNGGGHKAAAGFTLYMSLEEAVPYMRERITQLLSE